MKRRLTLLVGSLVAVLLSAPVALAEALGGYGGQGGGVQSELESGGEGALPFTGLNLGLLLAGALLLILLGLGLLRSARRQ
jgi:hypothetical protein